MELNLKVRTTIDEIEDVFEYDDIILIKSYNLIKEGLYDVNIRVPECNLENSNRVTTFDSIKRKIEKDLDFEFKCIVLFENGAKRRVVAKNKYWFDYAIDMFEKREKSNVEKIIMDK